MAKDGKRIEKLRHEEKMKTLQTFSVQRKLSLLTLACSACLGGGL